MRLRSMGTDSLTAHVPWKHSWLVPGWAIHRREGELDWVPGSSSRCPQVHRVTWSSPILLSHSAVMTSAWGEVALALALGEILLGGRGLVLVPSVIYYVILGKLAAYTPQ